MSYEVIIKPSAEKSIDDLPRRVRETVLEELEELSRNPRKPGTKPLHHNLKGLWKDRVGDCRIAYKIEENRLIVLVAAVGDRKEIYRILERMRKP